MHQRAFCQTSFWDVLDLPSGHPVPTSVSIYPVFVCQPPFPSEAFPLGLFLIPPPMCFDRLSPSALPCNPAYLCLPQQARARAHTHTHTHTHTVAELPLPGEFVYISME